MSAYGNQLGFNTSYFTYLFILEVSDDFVFQGLQVGCTVVLGQSKDAIEQTLVLLVQLFIL
jgi:hypothetical protein